MDQTIAKLIESRPALPDITQVPAVKALQAKLDALKARRDDLDRQVRQVLAEQPTKRATDAQALFDGIDADADDHAADVSLDQRLAELRKAQRITSEALEIGHKELRRVVRVEAPKLLGEVQRWHRQVVVEAAKLMVHLDVLAGAEQVLLNDIQQSGLPEGSVTAELAQHLGSEWLITRMLADGILDGNEDWLPDHLRPAKPGVAAQAASVMNSAINAVRRAVGQGKPAAKPADMGGHELWQ